MKVFIALLIGLVGFVYGDISGYRRGVEKTEFKFAANKVGDERLSELQSIFESEGVHGVAKVCLRGQLVEKTSPTVGALWIECGATASFYDPATYKVVTKGNDVILPVALFTRVENGLDYLEKGWRVKDVSIAVWVFRDPEETKRLGNPQRELTIASLD